MIFQLNSLKTRLVALTGALVLLSLIGLTAYNNVVARKSALDLLTHQADALARSHASTIADWVSVRKGIVQSFTDKAAEADPVPALLQANKAGNFLQTYFGYADKRFVNFKPLEMPPGYDPTARPWYI